MPDHDTSDHGPRPATAPQAPPGLAAVAGLVSAAAALAAGELVVGISGDGRPSLVSSVGTAFIDRFAASLKELAVSLFGTNDKAALVVGIVTVSLALGAVLGVASRRHRWVGPAGFAAFGLLGFSAYRDDPLGSSSVGAVAAVVAATTGAATLWFLLDLAARTAVHTAVPAPAGTGTGRPAAPGAGVVGEVDDGVLVDGRLVVAPRGAIGLRGLPRRAFLAAAGAVGAGAVLAAGLGRRLGAGSPSEEARATQIEAGLPRPTTTDPDATTVDLGLRGLSPYITPTDTFYRIDTALTVPQVDLDGWRLEVTGLVDRPFEISYGELLAMDSVADAVTIACVSNEVGGDLIGNAVWQGVPLATLLERAGVQARGTQIVGRSLDGWTAGFPTGLATDGRTALVAYAMNGEPLPVAHGFPARLIVAGVYGYVSATKWLSQIELTTWDAFDGYWIPRGWSKEGPIKTQSRIDVPRAGADLDAGATPIAGVAWAQTRGIARVEVRIDDGPWQRCRLGDVSGDDTWVQWLLEWDAPPGEHLITVRAVDGDGRVQTADVSNPAPDGATGHHTRRVRVRPRP